MFAMITIPGVSFVPISFNHCNPFGIFFIFSKTQVDMKKAILSILLVTASLTAFSQNWVEVGVDTVCGPAFLPNDIVYLGSDTILIPGFSFDFNNSNNRIKNGFYASYDSGESWDTLRYFNRCIYDGANYRVAEYDTLLYIIEGEYSTNQPPLQSQYQPACFAYELNLYNNRFQKVKSILKINQLPRYKWLGDVTPISPNIVLLSMLDVAALNQTVIGIPNFYIERLDVNSLAMDSIALPVWMENIYKIHFVDSLRGYMVGGSVYEQIGGYLLYTQDGGRTWVVMKQALSGIYHDINFYDQANGILSGDEDIYFTSNSGFDWYPSSGTPSRFKAIDVAIASDENAYAIGWYSEYVNGLQESSVQIYKSLDKGRNWCLVYEDTSSFYYHHEYKSMHISFSNENHGVAAYGYNRLIYTTNGGGLTECITGINEAENELMVNIYPNPSNGTFTVDVPNTILVDNLSIYDLSGSVVFQSATESSSVLVNGLSSGMYILQVQTSEGVHTQKVIVE